MTAPASGGATRPVLISSEVLRQVKLVELRTRRLVNSLFSGEYRSIFKGQGMEFAEVREYQPGDEVRSIDWNVTARMRRPFVKRYIEERELTLMLAVDISGSERYGTVRRFKSELATELARLSEGQESAQKAIEQYRSLLRQDPDNGVVELMGSLDHEAQGLGRGSLVGGLDARSPEEELGGLAEVAAVLFGLALRRGRRLLVVLGHGAGLAAALEDRSGIGHQVAPKSITWMRVLTLLARSVATVASRYSSAKVVTPEAMVMAPATRRSAAPVGAALVWSPGTMTGVPLKTALTVTVNLPALVRTTEKPAPMLVEELSALLPLGLKLNAKNSPLGFGPRRGLGE